MRLKNRFSTNNDINNPDHTSDMYISENDRLFGDNFATADYYRRKMENEKKKEKYKLLQNQLFERERKRWERLDNEYLRTENQSMMNKERNLVGRKSNPRMAFNPLNLQYDNNVQGEILKRSDEESKYRAWLRSLNIDKHSNAGYNIINGEERTILEERLNKDIVPDLIQKNIEQINEMENKVFINNNNFYTRCNPASPDLRRYRYDDRNSRGNLNGKRINKSTTTPNLLNNNGGRFRAPVDFRDERNYYNNGNDNGSRVNQYGVSNKQYIDLKNKVKNNVNQSPISFSRNIYSNYFGKKLELNILYYDDKLLNTEENNLNCSFFKKDIKGTFYGCHNENLFKFICEKIKNSDKEFILISSGSSAEKIYDYWSDIWQIKYYYIYCFKTEKYPLLKRKLKNLKGIYKIFDELRQALSSINPMRIKNIRSSNLFSFNDYNRIYIKLHYEIIIKYALYKLFKRFNSDETNFFDLVRNKYPYYLNLAEQLVYDDDRKMIDLFKANTNENEETLRDVFNPLKHTFEDYIHNYTKESFYYKYLNKFLREGDFDNFRILSNHISKFIYSLNKHREIHLRRGNLQSILYRNTCFSPKDFKVYKESVGSVICYPSFTSTSLNDNFVPIQKNINDLFIRLIIYPNNSKSVVNIRVEKAFRIKDDVVYYSHHGLHDSLEGW